jgi:hypothetical protein
VGSAMAPTVVLTFGSIDIEEHHDPDTSAA